MKFTLKDYQAEAVRDALDNLKKARKRWHEDDDIHAFSLTAVTGAGKTVMAAAAFEALFYGDDELDFDADPGAVVIWFSDDPALNEQTRFRLMEASDRIRHTDLVVVENTFNRSKFEAGKIYFLNTQKLGKNSLLVRGFDGEADGGLFPETRPDMRSYTIWDTIRSTIEDPSLTLYLVLDEAHRGMGNLSRAAESAKSTIVQRLINGANGVPGIPVVWGISATVERFKVAMKDAQKRTTLPDVVVDTSRVQESGLIKDNIILDIPDDIGDFDTVLVRRAADTLKASTKAWAEYAKQQDEASVVLPLMVLQVPNTPDPDDISRALDTIYQRWPDLPNGSVAHVFGEHTGQLFGNHEVPYISPEHVQESTWVRILLAKDAISTGWDCPRAEVMVSFRSATDRTHITQLLGRMVRSPLARRIPGNERLNSVHCLLPRFNRNTVREVVDALMRGDDLLPPPNGRVLINPVEMKPNPAATEAVWQIFESLPSQSRPQRGANPAKRLTALAHELAADNLLPRAGMLAHAQMHAVLDTLQDRFKQEIESKRNAVLNMDGISILADIQRNRKSFNQFLEEADMAVIDDAYRLASRIFSPDIARTYVESRAARTAADGDQYEEALVDARVSIAALGLLTNVEINFDVEADKLSNSWLKEYGDSIRGLSDDRQEIYRQIKEMSAEPQDLGLVKPAATYEPSMARENDIEIPLPKYTRHLLCDADGNYSAILNSWEVKVVETEMKRKGFIFWYRNPSYPGQSSLGIAYLKNNHHYGILRPDFIFFSSGNAGAISADIVDPHSIHLDDALPKLKGLSTYAKTHGKCFRRIESVALSLGKLRVLDLTKEEVRAAIANATDAASLYSGDLALDY